MSARIVDLDNDEIRGISGAGFVKDSAILLANMAAPVVGFAIGVALFLLVTKEKEGPTNQV